jgi:hypothetical protein
MQGRGIKAVFCLLGLAVVAGGIVGVLGLSPQAEPTHAAVEGDVVGTADLRPAPSFPNASGEALIVLYPRHAEVDLELRKLPRPDPKHKVFLLWLSSGGGHTHIGSAFPRGGRQSLSAVVPGDGRVSRNHARRARRAVITLLARQRAKELALDARKADWRKNQRIVGKRVLRVRSPAATTGVPPDYPRHVAIG